MQIILSIALPQYYYVSRKTCKSNGHFINHGQANNKTKVYPSQLLALCDTNTLAILLKQKSKLSLKYQDTQHNEIMHPHRTKVNNYTNDNDIAHWLVNWHSFFVQERTIQVDTHTIMTHHWIQSRKVLHSQNCRTLGHLH